MASPALWRRAVGVLGAVTATGLLVASPAFGQSATTPTDSTTAPVPSQTPGSAQECAETVTVGLLQVRAQCLARHGLVWTTSEGATVGGLAFVPTSATAKLTFDPLNVRVAAHGYKVQVQGELFGDPLPPIVLHRAGPIDMSFQANPTVVGLVGGIAASSGRRINLSHIATLPGLATVDQLPRIEGAGYPDYRAVTEAQVDELATRVTTLRSRDVGFTAQDVGIVEMEPLTFRTSGNDGDLFGLKVGGEVTLTPARRESAIGLDVKLRLHLPAVLGGLTGATHVFVGADGTLDADNLQISAAKIEVPPVRMQPVHIAYDKSAGLWEATVGLYFDPGATPSVVGVEGDLRISQGRLERIGATVTGLPVTVGPLVIFRLGGTLLLNPFGLEARAAVGVGPKVPATGEPLVNVDGTFGVTTHDIQMGGDITVGNAMLGNGSVRYAYTGTASITGTLEHTIAPGLGFTAEVAGHVNRAGANVEGSGVYTVPGGWSLSGKALVSTVGMAGCGTLTGPVWFGTLHVGVGYRWGDPEMTWFGGVCDMAPYRVLSSHERGVHQMGFAPGVPRTVQVRQGDRAVAMRVTGSAASPEFVLRGPHGRTISTPSARDAIQAKRYMLVKEAGDRSTTVLVARPAAGAWTITPKAGSDVASVAVSDPLPLHPVIASLRGGRVSYAIRRVPGQTVTISEEGPDVSRVLVTGRTGPGSVAFTPSRGPAGTRRVVVQVRENGLVRQQNVIARVRVRASTLASPLVTIARRSLTRARISWTPVPGATAYEAVATFDGRTETYEVGRRRMAITIGGVLPTSGVSVRVRALSTFPLTGPAGIAHGAPAIATHGQVAG